MIRQFLTAASCIALSTAAYSQQTDDTNIAPESDIEEVIVTGTVSTFGATKSNTPIVETARSISVITSDQFQKWGALTLDDTLNYSAGVVGDTFGFSTRGDFPAVRGLQVPEFLDNIQVLFGFYNNARSDIYTLEQVEVLRGPASVLYGQGSPGGILNTVSKRASQANQTKQLVAEYGTFDRAQISADLGFSLSENVSARLVSIYREADTQVDFVQDDAFVVMPSLTYEDENTILTALVNYTDRESDTAHQFLPLSVTACGSNDVTISEANVCAFASGNEADPSVYAGHPDFNRYDTESLSVTVFAVQELFEGVTAEATARYRDNEADYSQSWASFLGDGNPRTLPDGTAVARSWYDAPAGSEQFAVDARLRAQFETGDIRHEVLAGFNYQDVSTELNAAFIYAQPTVFNFFNPTYPSSEVPSAASFDAVRALTETDTETLGFYLNDQIELGNLIMNAGIRYDEVTSETAAGTQKDDAVSFSFGALYQTSIGLNPYISYAESFQPVIGVDGITGDALDPQRGKQWEAGVKYQPDGSGTYISLAVFDIDQTNLPTPSDLPNAVTQQEGSASIQGLEAEAHIVMGDWYADLAFSLLDTEDPDGIRFASVPESQGSVWIGWEPSDSDLEGLRIGAGARIAGGNESSGTAFLAANSFAPSPVLVETDGYVVFDALVGYDFGDVVLTVNARNLFNTEYYGTCLSRGDCFPGEQRTVMARLAYAF